MINEENYFEDISLLWISRYDYKSSWRLEKHIHPYFQLIYCLEGKAEAQCNSNAYFISPKTLLFIKPKEEHSINQINPNGLKTLDVKFVVNNDEFEKKLLGLPSLIETHDEEIRDFLERIRIEGEEQDFEYKSRSRLFLALILTNLIRESKPKKEIGRLSYEYYYRDNLSNIIVKLIAYIQNNYKKQISSSSIEENLNLSYRFISKQAKKEIGLTPIEFLDHYRIHVAKDLLSTTNKTLKEITQFIGYPNIHHFSRSFSKLVGIPPGKYRAEITEGIRKDIFFSDNFVNENNTTFS